MIRRLVFLLAATALLGGFVTTFGTTAGTAQDIESQGRKGAERAASYINPDTGLATENPNVKPNSECGRPDQLDGQILSEDGSTDNNVHNDACLFRNGGRFDGKASFEIRGVGVFSACPDPDGAGPKTSATKQGGKRCFLTGYQESGGAMDGDLEYHARVNNDSRPGSSFVTFCGDPDDNGCGDARAKDQIEIRWRR